MMMTAGGQIDSLLVVDDSSVQRSWAVALFRQLGVKVVYEAANGLEAMDLLKLLVLPPDLVVLDLEMPGMDGVELIERMHQRQYLIPLVVASGREPVLIQSVELMARNLGLPVLASLQKPLEARALNAALQRYGQLRIGATVIAAAPHEPITRERLAEALAQSEISVHYQPKVDMRTGIVRGVEALARWHRQGQGYVRPDVFIAAAEELGLIHRLTLSVMRQAAAQAAHWNARGLRLSMAINLSPLLLNGATLVDEVCSLVAEQGLKAEQLVLEITESTLADRVGTALGVLARLRMKGFGLSIDDYGTGYSSMQQLARIPFTELKIDRSFVHGAAQRKNLRVILHSALEMARQLDMVAVAEGIETLEDWRLLQEFGCNIGQGYLIAKPMPASELPHWLRLHQGRQAELRQGAASAAAHHSTPMHLHSDDLLP